jgi:hypothetical protein
VLNSFFSNKKGADKIQVKQETFSSGFGSSNDIFGSTNGTTNGQQEQEQEQVNGSESTHSLDTKSNQVDRIVLQAVSHPTKTSRLTLGLGRS